MEDGPKTEVGELVVSADLIPGAVGFVLGLLVVLSPLLWGLHLSLFAIGLVVQCAAAVHVGVRISDWRERRGRQSPTF